MGNLVSVSLPNGTQIQYLIDGQNRRVGKIVNGKIVKRWLYQNQLNIVAELDSVGNVSSRFVYGTKGHVPDYMVKDGVTYRFITDHLGSVRFVVDVASGTVVQYISYDEFGNILTDTNPDFQPFGYAGGLYDSETGLVRFGARDYDCFTGRWTGKDPIGFLSNQTNFYIYAYNDPINFNDFNGWFGTADFVYHYYFGGGRPIDLGFVGLLDNFKRSTSVKEAVGDFSKNLLQRAYVLANSLCVCSMTRN